MSRALHQSQGRLSSPAALPPVYDVNVFKNTSLQQFLSHTPIIIFHQFFILFAAISLSRPRATSSTLRCWLKFHKKSINSSLFPSLLGPTKGVRSKPNGTEKDVLPNNSSLRRRHLSFPHIINITATALNMMAAIRKAPARVGLVGSRAHFVIVDSCFPVTVPCARGPFPLGVTFELCRSHAERNVIVDKQSCAYQDGFSSRCKQKWRG